MPVQVDHVVGVGDGDQPGRQRHRLARQPARVAPVPALVVGLDDLRDRGVAVDPAHDRGAVLRVAFDRLPLLVGQARVGEQDLVAEGELADVVQQPGGVDDVLLLLAHPERRRHGARVAGDRRGVARGHPVAQRQRLDHRDQHAQLQLCEPLGPRARQQQLAQQVLEREQHEQHQRHRRDAGLHVEGGHECAQHRAEDLAGQDREEDRAELPAQRHARLEGVMAGDHQEVEEVRHHEDREHEQRERGSSPAARSRSRAPT